MPWALAMVTKGGSVEADLAEGLADVQAGVTCTPGTRFRLCSVSKQFAAAAVMFLRQPDYAPEVLSAQHPPTAGGHQIPRCVGGPPWPSHDRASASASPPDVLDHEQLHTRDCA